MEKESLNERSYNHLAFKIDNKDYNKLLEKIKEYGLEIKDNRKRIEVAAKSIYFYDYDTHLFDFHTRILDERLATRLQ